MGWIGATLRINFANMVSHQKTFWTMAVLMCVQNLIYFSLWAVMFSQISTLKGWGLNEIAFLFGSACIGAGIFFGVFGGVNQISTAIHSGMLDVYLTRPRSTILSLLLSRMRADSLGDILSGTVMLVFIVRPPLESLPLVLCLSVLAGIVFLSFRMMMHSLAFFGLGSEAAENGFIAFLIAATNPQKGFGIWGKMVLLTVFPAGYIALLPVELLREFTWPMMVLQLAGSLAVLLVSIGIFHFGLKRYASGNQFLVLR